MAKKVYKVLAYCDSPAAETGFAQVAKEIFAALKRDTEIEYEITVAAINHFLPYYDQKVYPYQIWSGLPYNDALGKKLFPSMMAALDFDILFTFNDLGLINQFIEVIGKVRKAGKKFVWLTYSPVDNEVSVPAHFSSFLEADIPVAYTQYGKDMASKLHPVLKTKLKIIYHGTDPLLFYPVASEKREEWRKNHFPAVTKEEGDVFLVGNINRNQWRKDLGRSMLAFKLFKEKLAQYDPKANTKLYLHSKAFDIGGNLMDMGIYLGLTPGVDYIVADIQNESTGIPREAMNIIYNCADVIISTAAGEGWGLSCTEAMAAKRPVIMPRNTSLIEMVGENEERGYLVKSGGTSLQTIFYGNGSNQVVFRPLVDVEDMVEKLFKVYLDWEKNHEYAGTETGEKMEAALEWAKTIKWNDDIGAQWRDVFSGAVKRVKRIK